MKLFYWIVLLFFTSFSIVSQEHLKPISKQSPIISIDSLDRVPIYPKCIGNNEALKKCFVISVNKFIASKFNFKLLTRKIIVKGVDATMSYRVNRNGIVDQINVTSSNKKIASELVRVLKLLPRMKPAVLGNRRVGVVYSSPFSVLGVERSR